MNAPGDDAREEVLARCLGWASATFDHVYRNQSGSGATFPGSTVGQQGPVTRTK